MRSYDNKKVDRTHTNSLLKCRCDWCQLAHSIVYPTFAPFCDNIGPWFSIVYFDITESYRFSLGNYSFGESSSFAMRLYGISAGFHNYLSSYPLNFFILFGTYRYTRHLLCQLSFCTILQDRHRPTWRWDWSIKYFPLFKLTLGIETCQ